MRRFRSVRGVIEALLVVLLLGAAVAVVAGPLRRGPAQPPPGDPERDALDAAKETKYAEIREAELDRRTGKLSERDWREVDAALRAEAIEILREIDRATARGAADRRAS
jgi:hypothetical protein